jgi:hypothetical protein
MTLWWKDLLYIIRIVGSEGHKHQTLVRILERDYIRCLTMHQQLEKDVHAYESWLHKALPEIVVKYHSNP